MALVIENSKHYKNHCLWLWNCEYVECTCIFTTVSCTHGSAPSQKNWEQLVRISPLLIFNFQDLLYTGLK